MFTGIIQAVGKIDRVEPRGQAARLLVSAGELDLSDVDIGDSIAVSGVCLTVVNLAGRIFAVDVSGATLGCTHGLNVTGEVNLEKALRLSDRLGGHLVSGHVDGVGEVTRFQPAGESFLLEIRAPHPLQATTLKNLIPGAQVNLEADMLARYVERLLAFEHRNDKD